MGVEEGVEEAMPCDICYNWALHLMVYVETTTYCNAIWDALHGWILFFGCIVLLFEG